ncbi:MAG: ATP-binding protein [Campylobacterales bacterium]|nr:ATP-binding protein [Campylobacterales bacterium]
MEALLDDYYKQSVHVSRFIDRKATIESGSLQIIGVALCGKTALIKHYLSTCKKGSYLYIDCRDLRIDDEQLSKLVGSFCARHDIDILALDNYRETITLPPHKQLIVSGERPFALPGLPLLRLVPLDYEEFLAYEPKYDSTVFNHYLQLGGYPIMHTLPAEARALYLQQILQLRLSPLELDILILLAKNSALKTSAFTLYERLRHQRRVSKDMLYKTLADLIAKRYVFELPKFGYLNATKKFYLCDIALKHALSTQKHFGRLFEHLVFLEILKRGITLYYGEGVDFYLPHQRRIVLCMPFGTEDLLFKRIETIEGFIAANGVDSVQIVSVGSEGSLQHPMVQVEMIPFGEWAITLEEEHE